ncbi:SDR family oxidoreductase [Paenibacillus sp. 22594]|uniref:SDR family oxidoreductase n=1 Tax=Paenibacillus sp. 22594 TaxID=3453947 RepID=UPI003F86B13A
MEIRKMKVLILGATGMAGHTISLYLQERGHDVTAFSTKKFPYCKNINGDAMDKELIISVLQKNKYDAVINCIGVLNSSCDLEPSRAVYLNSYLPHLIADTLKETKTKLIHMSTDCVFSGKDGNYDEKSFPDGETFYDRTKALGEVIDKKNLTFRNSIIGPDLNRDGIGLFNWFMKQDGVINGYTKAIWTGVTTLTLAKAMEEAINNDISGIYNLVNNDSISKMELLKLLNYHIRKNEVEIIPNAIVNIDKSLVNKRTDFSFEVPNYEQMIIEMKDWIYLHKDLYPHYFRGA